MSETADLLQTFTRGIERPEDDQAGYGVAVNEQRNFNYFRLFGTTAQRPDAAPEGWTYFDTDEDFLVVKDGDGEWVEIEGGGGGGLTPPASPADNGKVGIASAGDVVWTALSALTVGNATAADAADTATTAAVALAVQISGPTDIGFGAVTDGHLLVRSGSNFVGVAASALAVSSAATAALATVSSGLRTATPTDLTIATIADGELLVRSGTTIDGVAANALNVLGAQTADYSLGLRFGSTDRDSGATAPTTNQLLVCNGSDLVGLDPGDVLRRKTSSNTSTAAIVFTANVVWTWNGSTTVSLTADTTGAVDGAEITLFFPASSMNSFALHANIDPTGLVASTFTSNLKAYLLRLKYHACGPCIEVLNFSEVTDL